MQAGWYPDPTGRFEHRYFNGAIWTADVATGGERAVDPWGAAPHPPGAPDSGHGLATAAMTVGIVAAGIGAILVLFFVALPMGIVASVLGLVAWSRARRTGTGRGQAIAALVLGPAAIALGIAGTALFWTDIRDAFRDAQIRFGRGTYSVTLDSCAPTGAEVVASGRITNDSTSSHSYRIRLEFLPAGSTELLARSEAEVTDVAPDATATFQATAPLATSERIRCFVTDVLTD